MSKIFYIEVQNKSCIFPIEISDKALYFIITASLRLKMARNAGNCIIFAGKSEINRVVKQRSTSESVLRAYYGPSLQLPTSRFALGW